MENELTPDKKQDDVVSIKLPAPKGWTKKLIPKPRRNEVVFISPTGEGIKTKKHLDQYLKSHPGSYSLSDFDWTTGDTPRRSARLSGKSNASESSGSETPKKKRKVEPRRKVLQKKDDLDEEDETADDKEGTVEEKKENAEVSEDAEDGGEQNDGKELTKEPDLVKDDTKDSEKKSDLGEVVTEEPVHGDEKIDVKLETHMNSAGTEMEKGGNMDAGNKASDAQNEDAENRPQPSTAIEDSIKEALTASTGAEAAADLPTTNENPSVQELDANEAASLKVADGGPTDGKVEQMSQSVNEASVEKVENEELAEDKRKKNEVEKPIDNHPANQ